MIIISPELDKFVVEPWMELKPFDSKLIKEIFPDHPFKILLRILYKYYPSYSSGKGNDANPNYVGYEDVIDLYFKMLDDYNRYGIAFQRKYELFPDNKLGVFEYKDFGKPVYHLVNNHYDKKVLLFNNVKTIDLSKHDRGEKPILEEEKQKRDLIKKQTNKKLQVAMIDPDVYNNDELLKVTLERGGMQHFPIEKFNHRMSYHGFDELLRIKIDLSIFLVLNNLISKLSLSPYSSYNRMTCS